MMILTLFPAQCLQRVKHHRTDSTSILCPSETFCNPCRAISDHDDDRAVYALYVDRAAFLISTIFKYNIIPKSLHLVYNVCMINSLIGFNLSIFNARNLNNYSEHEYTIQWFFFNLSVTTHTLGNLIYYNDMKTATLDGNVDSASRTCTLVYLYSKLNLAFNQLISHFIRQIMTNRNLTSCHMNQINVM